MAKEADAHSAEDKARREEIDAKNQLDSMVYNIEKMLKEHGDKISGSERGDVENALADAKKAIEGGDKAQMDSAREKLTAASHKLAEQMYKATQATPGAGRVRGRTDDGHAALGHERRGPEEGRRRDRRRVRGRRRQEITRRGKADAFVRCRKRSSLG
jgi:molecular chaperone DnaK